MLDAERASLLLDLVLGLAGLLLRLLPLLLPGFLVLAQLLLARLLVLLRSRLRLLHQLAALRLALLVLRAHVLRRRVQHVRHDLEDCADERQDQRAEALAARLVVGRLLVLVYA